MWYIFDTNFVLKGVISEHNSVTIEHYFYECDVLSMELPYTQETYEALSLGDILHRGKNKKGYIIHTIEVNEGDKNIFIGAYGIESLMNQRIISKPFEANKNIKRIIYELVYQNLGSGASVERRINSLVLPAVQDQGEKTAVSYYGENLYTVVSELSKSYGIGVKFNFNPYPEYALDGRMISPPKVDFSMMEGQDLTYENQSNPPIIWKANWGDTRDETLFLSQKDYKNVIHLKSGDEEKPIEYQVVESSTNKGWKRFELFTDASDIKRQMDQDTILTDVQVKQLLHSRGQLELFRNYKNNDFTFILNQDIPQIFEKDFFVGDKVTVVNETFGITRHSRIVSVIETVIQEKSQIEIKFEE